MEVGGKTDWDLGVASQSINRKGKVEVTPSNGYWFLSLRDKNKYSVRTEPAAELPQKIGVFLDYDKGQVRCGKCSLLHSALPLFHLSPPLLLSCDMLECVYSLLYV